MTTTKPADPAAGGFHSVFFKHLATYSAVDYAFKTAQDYYTRAKKVNKYLEYGFETAEYLTSAATKTAEPLLVKVDEFSLRQFVKAEETLSTSYETVAQLPFSLLEKALDMSEESLDYFLPVDGGADKKEEQKKEEQQKEEKPTEPVTLSKLGDRWRDILATHSVRAKDRLHKSPYVQYTKAKYNQASSLPSTVSQYYTERKNAVTAKVTPYYTNLTHYFSSLQESAFDFFYYLHHQYDTLRSYSLQELGIRFANSAHSVAEYLYDRFYPKKLLQSLYQRSEQLLKNLLALFPLIKKRETTQPPTDNGDKHEGKKSKADN